MEGRPAVGIGFPAGRSFRLKVFQSVKNRQMRFNGQNHFILAFLMQPLEERGQLSVTMAGCDERAGLHDGIRDMDVGDSVVEDLIGLQRTDMALNEIGRVKDKAHSRTEVPEKIRAALGDVAIDPFFIFMHQQDAGISASVIMRPSLRRTSSRRTAGSSPLGG